MVLLRSLEIYVSVGKSVVKNSMGVLRGRIACTPPSRIAYRGLKIFDDALVFGYLIFEQDGHLKERERRKRRWQNEIQAERSMREKERK